MKKLLFALLVSAPLLSYAQGYRIEVQQEKWQDTIVWLAYNYGDKAYYKDTGYFNSEGYVVFEGQKPLDCGMYLVVMPDVNMFRLVIGEDQVFKATAKTTDFINTMKIEGSVENQYFYDDMRFLGTKGQVRSTLQGQLPAATTKLDSTRIQDQLKNLNDEVMAFREANFKKHPNSLYTAIVKASQDLSLPKAPEGLDDEARRQFFYSYIRKHHFDDVDFSNDCLLRTPVFHQKLDEYVKKWTLQVADSVIKTCDYVLSKARANKEVFKYTLIYLLNEYANNEVMCMEAVYVHLVDNYYLSDPLVDWVEEDRQKTFKKDADGMRHNLCGLTAPEMHMQTDKGDWKKMSEIESPWTLLVFWDHDCGHCKKVMPVLHNMYLKYKDYGFQVWAVNTSSERQKFLDYVSTKDWKWINVSDPEQKTYYKFFYNIKSTPRMFMVDDQKVIRAKRLSIGQFAEFLDAQFDTDMAAEFLEADKKLGKSAHPKDDADHSHDDVNSPGD